MIAIAGRSPPCNAAGTATAAAYRAASSTGTAWRGFVAGPHLAACGIRCARCQAIRHGVAQRGGADRSYDRNGVRPGIGRERFFHFLGRLIQLIPPRARVFRDAGPSGDGAGPRMRRLVHKSVLGVATNSIARSAPTPPAVAHRSGRSPLQMTRSASAYHQQDDRIRLGRRPAAKRAGSASSITHGLAADPNGIPEPFGKLRGLRGCAAG
jgi:hypothetical protein